ncbi:MAG: MFS transporter [Bifidobacteriaceae bacterium]|jgi:MFS family permease|nr:MFS transporter [Bifidobacteriaceae bacterium]
MRPYLELFRIPGAAAFCVAALVARAGGAMIGIGTVVMVSEQYDSYALAGGLSASNVIAWAIGTAVLSNMVDRHGQRRVMLPATMVSAATLAVLVVLGTIRAPAWMLFAPAVISGMTGGAPGALVRARWNLVVRNARQLHTAFSLESTLDELCFVIGPVAATLLGTQVAPAAGLVAPVILGAGGGLWFYSLRATEPPVAARGRVDGIGRAEDLGGAGGRADVGGRPGVPGSARRELILLLPGVGAVALVTVMIGLLFGSCDVTVVAATEAWGVKQLSGPVLAAMSLGSAIGGLTYGSRNWVSSVARRWVVCLGLLALACVSVLFAGSPAFLAVAGFAAGLAIAPTLINLNTLMQSLAPTDRLTEGLAWVSTSLGVGVSIGASVSGQLIDQIGYRAGFVAMVAAGFVAAALALLNARSVSRTARRVAAERRSASG